MKTTLRFGWILLCLALALGARCWNVRDIFVEGHIYFVDGDCYSRMTRARMVAEHPGMIVRHHDFENWPQGVQSHTTAPFDYLIVGLKKVLDVLFDIFDNKALPSLAHTQTLDLAGALISPLLGVAGAAFLAWWFWTFRVRFGAAALLIYSISPILVHGTLLGRPDHQSLLMFLLTVALGAELTLAQRGNDGAEVDLRAWGIVSGLAWGLSLWVSLYEPIILLGMVVGVWLWLDRRSFISRERLAGACALGAILLLSLLVEGWPISVPDPAVRTYFPNWQHTIGELSHLQIPLLFGWLGWGAIAAPVLLCLAWRQDRRAVALLVVLGGVFLLTLWQVRWGYFLGVVFAWTLPWQMQAMRRGWLAWLLFIVGLWPVLKEWDARLFPEDFARDRQTMDRAELVALRDLVVASIGKEGGPFLASWWLSPAIAYWTRQPGVAGTSHESLSGIADTARFFLSTDPATAVAILRRRPVHWVLADDPGREITTSSVLLGVPAPADPLATTLAEHPDEVPDFLSEWKGPAAIRADGIRFYRLYEVDDANLRP